MTGGDTGPGGSDVVAAIDTATNKVTADIKVGPAPRQVVFSHDGSTAYVTAETGIYEISTVTNKRRPGDPRAGATNGPQGIAVSPNGATLYVTNPGAGTRGRDRRRKRQGQRERVGTGRAGGGDGHAERVHAVRGRHELRLGLRPLGGNH